MIKTNTIIKLELGILPWIKFRGIATKLLANEIIGIRHDDINYEKWFTYFKLNSNSIRFNGIIPPQQVDLKYIKSIGYLSCKLSENSNESFQNFFVIKKNTNAFNLFSEFITPGNYNQLMLDLSKDFIEDSSLSTMITGCTELTEYKLNFSSRKIPSYLNTLAFKFNQIDAQLENEGVLPVSEFAYTSNR